jgi:hypothetical protein
MSQMRYLNEKVFDVNEEILLNKQFHKFISLHANFKEIKNLEIESMNYLDTDILANRIFLSLPVHRDNIKEFLNDYYKHRFQGDPVNSFEFSDFLALAYILIKSQANPEDFIYYKKSSFHIIYDLIQGKIGSFKESKYQFKIIQIFFDFLLKIFLNRSNMNEELINNLNEDKLLGIIRHNLSKPSNSSIDIEKCDFNTNLIIPQEIIDSSLECEKRDYVSNEDMELFLINFKNLDKFLCYYFNLQFMGVEYDASLMTSIPEMKEGGLTTEMYFLFCLMNEEIYDKKWGYKLFDTRKDGISIAPMIHSFLGFPGPVAIFIHHWEKSENKEYIIGALMKGIYMEPYPKLDDSTHLFFLFPTIRKLKFLDLPNRIALFQSKSLQSKPGIGFGNYKDLPRLWIDGKNINSDSYFLTYDSVFEEGSIFNESHKQLNIMNIEIYGFGSDEDLNTLFRKQGKDKLILEKMKKVDKKLITESDKDIFLSETFAHSSYGRKSSLENN